MLPGLLSGRHGMCSSAMRSLCKLATLFQGGVGRAVWGWVQGLKSCYILQNLKRREVQQALGRGLCDPSASCSCRRCKPAH